MYLAFLPSPGNHNSMLLPWSPGLLPSAKGGPGTLPSQEKDIESLELRKVLKSTHVTVLLTCV